MNLRSGRTLRRDSRNHEEFSERKLYQKEQRQNFLFEFYSNEEYSRGSGSAFISKCWIQIRIRIHFKC